VRSTDGGAPQLLFRLPLNIEFDNGSVQTLPLEATVLVPSLRLSTESLDFGVCFVGQTRELHVLLSIPTGSRSFWHCRLGTFFPRDAMHACIHVCVCVCLSQVGVLLKRLNVRSHKQHHTIAQGL